MTRAQLLLCLLGISTALLINCAEARRTRIYGGEDAAEGQFPYHVSLESGGQNFCGGSILSDRFVLTAAHCFVYKNGKFRNRSVNVVAGINDLILISRDKVSVDVAEVYVPKEYDRTKKLTVGDIAILKLNKDLGIKNNRKLAKVKLLNKNFNFDGFKANITGFGLNQIELVTNPYTGKLEEQNGKRTGKLRYASAFVISQENCRIFYPGFPPIKKHICAALLQRNKGPGGICAGDSGGPLVFRGAQIGIVSLSPLGCSEDQKPAVYTRVSSYISFINKVIADKIDDSIQSTVLTIVS